MMVLSEKPLNCPVILRNSQTYRYRNILGKKKLFKIFIQSLPYAMISSIFFFFFFFIRWCPRLLFSGLLMLCFIITLKRDLWNRITLTPIYEAPYTLRNLSFKMPFYLAFCQDSAPIRSIRKNNSGCIFEI